MLRAGIRRLAAAGVSDAASDARRLMAAALGVPAGRLTLALAEPISASQSSTYDAFLTRRAGRQPVSQIVGHRLFWGREFLVTPDVLDPRPETEALVACALEEPFGRLLDLGTGSGCILVTLLAERPEAVGTGADLSDAALAVAARNAARHGVERRATFRHGDWLDGLAGPFDLIVSNPPYIALAEMLGLAPEVRDHEPRLALTDEGDGLAAYRAILGGAGALLAFGGRVMVEVGASQAEAVLAIGRAAGLTRAETRLDLDGRARVCLFRAA